MLRYVGVIQLLFLMGHVCLIDVWLSEDLRTNIVKSHAKNKLDYVFKFY